MTETVPAMTPGQTLRTFLRAHPTVCGALEALDAVADLERLGLAAEREAALSAALVRAQRAALPIYKRSSIDLREGRGSYKVADTEQAVQVARDALGANDLMVNCTAGNKVVVGGALFLDLEFEVRHAAGGTLRARYQWPVVYAGGPIGTANAERQARTSALGYYLRDLLLLPRLKDETEGAAVADARRSGPRRAEPRGAPKLSDKASAALGAIRAATNLDTLERAESRVADLRAALDDPAHAPYSADEVEAMAHAIETRRTELAGATEPA